MKKRFKLILFLPFSIFAVGVCLYVETENEARVQFIRAQDQWRNGQHGKAIHLYEGVLRDYPKSRYADDALWEMGTIHYVNLHHADRAVLCFQKLLRQYPESVLATETELRLAEIHEAELGDIARAISYWQQVLGRDPPPELSRPVRFKIANAHFKISQFQVARDHFQRVVNAGPSDHLSQQSEIRVGTIMQIQKDYPGSAEYFRRVLASTECDDCRIQAQLGLIESCEFMEELGRAIETAQAIRQEGHLLPMREGLLERLREKGRYYETRNRQPLK